MSQFADYDVHGRFACFYGGCFSQWYPSVIRDGDLQFNCAEQAMMYRKAEFFGDEDSMEKIMLARHPQEQKALGRLVTNFDADRWNTVCRDIVYKNNLLKFGQNRKLKRILLATDGLTLVEASPYDRIWGIGRGLDYPHLADTSKWRGTNWLGIAITQVREYFLSHEE